jgi:hypothetical protein
MERFLVWHKDRIAGVYQGSIGCGSQERCDGRRTWRVEEVSDSQRILLKDFGTYVETFDGFGRWPYTVQRKIQRAQFTPVISR